MQKLGMVFSLMLVSALAACGDDTGGAGGAGGSAAARPTCETIGETCHDVQTTLGQECHEFGEDAANDEEACKARETECLGECEGGGTTSSTSSTSSATSSTSTGG